MAIPLTAEWLKSFLTGVDLTDDDERYYSPEVFDTAIRSAIAWAESTFGIRIHKETVTERIDASGMNLTQYPPIQLPDALVTSLISCNWKLGNSTTILPWPLDWLILRGNQIQMIPAATGVGGMGVTNFPLYAQAIQLMGSGLPAIWEVTYEAGVETEGEIKDLSVAVASNAAIWKPSVHVWDELTISIPTVDSVARTFLVYGYRKEDGKPFDGLGRLGIDFPAETVTIPIGATSITTDTAWSQVTKVEWTGWTKAPAVNVTFSGHWNDPTQINMDWDLMALIGKVASIGILNIAGDMVIGAGIASKNVSIDAISSGLQTTASATNTAYGARIVQLQREINALKPILFRKYNGFTVAAW